jgi:hypothetical protein
VAKWYARVRWSPRDIQELRPSWTLLQCQVWLEDNQKYIVDAMIPAGWDAIEALLPLENDDDNRRDKSQDDEPPRGN